MRSSVDFLARIATASLEDKGGAVDGLKIHEDIYKETTIQFGSEGLGFGSVYIETCVFHKDVDNAQSRLWFGEVAAKRGTEAGRFQYNQQVHRFKSAQSCPAESRAAFITAGSNLMLSLRSGLEGSVLRGRNRF